GDELGVGRRANYTPVTTPPQLIRAVRARGGANMQRGELPPAPGLRNHAAALARNIRAEAHGAGGARPLVVAVADDVRPTGCGIEAHCAIHAMEDQTLQQRRAAPEE